MTHNSGRVVHDDPASLHLHFLEHTGNALQPHFSSSWLALVISGRRVQIGFQAYSFQVHLYSIPQVLGDAALEEGSGPDTCLIYTNTLYSEQMNLLKTTTNFKV